MVEFDGCRRTCGIAVLTPCRVIGSRSDFVLVSMILSIESVEHVSQSYAMRVRSILFQYDCNLKLIAPQETALFDLHVTAWDAK